MLYLVSGNAGNFSLDEGITVSRLLHELHPSLSQGFSDGKSAFGMIVYAFPHP